MSNDRRTSRPGFTVLELLIVITVIGVVSSLVLAGLVRARAAARLTQCQNNLRQFALAATHAAEVEGGFPTGSKYHLRLYPYAEETELLNQIAKASESPLDRGISSPAWVVCPEDSMVARNWGSVSYLLSNGLPVKLAGPRAAGVYRFGSQQSRSPREIIDGLSNTVLASERLQAPAFHPHHLQALVDQSFIARHEARYHYWPDSYSAMTSDINEFYAGCVDLDRTSSDWHPIDRSSFLSTLWHSASIGFNHVVSPNGPSCYRGDRYAGKSLSPTYDGSTPATSQHTGCVTVALCDGAVRTVSDYVDLDLWRALGTIAGAEPGKDF